MLPFFTLFHCQDWVNVSLQITRKQLSDWWGGGVPHQNHEMTDFGVSELGARFLDRSNWIAKKQIECCCQVLMPAGHYDSDFQLVHVHIGGVPRPKPRKDCFSGFRTGRSISVESKLNWITTKQTECSCQVLMPSDQMTVISGWSVFI